MMLRRTYSSLLLLLVEVEVLLVVVTCPGAVGSALRGNEAFGEAGFEETHEGAAMGAAFESAPTPLWPGLHDRRREVGSTPFPYDGNINRNVSRANGTAEDLLTWQRASWVFVQSPGPRLLHSMIGLRPKVINGTLDSAANGKALLFGGQTVRTPVDVALTGEPLYPSNDLWLFRVRSASWVQLHPRGDKRPHPRVGHVGELVVLDDKDHLVVFGGFFFNMDSFSMFGMSDLWLYSVEDNVWWEPDFVADSPWPSPRTNSGSTVCGNGTLFVYGGTRGTACNIGYGVCNFTAGTTTTDDEVWMLDMTASGPLRWERVIPVESPGPRTSHSIICLENTIYLNGGVRAPIDVLNRAAAPPRAVVDEGFIWIINTTQQPPLTWQKQPVVYTFPIGDVFTKEEFVSTFGGGAARFTDTTFGIVGGQHLATTWRPFIIVFDTQLSSWSIFAPTLTQLQSSFRVFSAAAHVAGTVLFHGGHNILTVLEDIHHVIPANGLVYPVPQQELPIERAYSAVTFSPDKGQLIIQGGFNGQVPLTDLWVLDFPTETWRHLFDDSPLGARFGHFVHPAGDLYIFGFGASLVNLQRDMYAFNVTSGSWLQVIPTNEAEVVRDILPRMAPAYTSFSPQGHGADPAMYMVMFAGLRIHGISDGFVSDVVFLDDMWLLDTRDPHAPTWRQVEREPGQPWPRPRNLGAMTTFETSSGRVGAFLYGGLSSDHAVAGEPLPLQESLKGSVLLDDAWVFWTDTERWHKLVASEPGKRVGHAIAFVAGHIMMGGGSTTLPHGEDVLGVATLGATEDTWLLPVSQLEREGSPIYAGNSNSAGDEHGANDGNGDSSISQGNGQRRSAPDVLTDRPKVPKTWLRVPTHLGTPRTHHFLFGHNDTLYVWGGRDSHQFHDTNIYDLRLGCLPGFASATGDFLDCHPCPRGTYQPVVGQLACEPCPESVTTADAGTMTILQCNLCVPGYCRNGRCHVDERLLPVCNCNSGWVGPRCGYNLAAAISMSVIGSLLGVGIVLFIIMKYRSRAGRMHTYAQLQEKLLGETKVELEELERAWEIFPDELQFVKRIDLASPGAFGQVWRAKFSDVMVAVKRLKHELDDLDEEAHAEFIAEIKFMRGLRHKNIVYFYGAGFINNQPFLVAEYMARGSLDSLLANASLDLPWERRLGFLLDTASGMNFLHSLTPPRIHRDLKSPNLLVNESWVVKVSDFGTGRLVEHLQAEAISAYGSQATETILPTMTSNVGTLLWCAPEVHAGKLYSLSADVYSFAIVMWECGTRELPFNHIDSPWDIRAAVERGERPPLVSDAPAGYNDLMQRCWYHSPAERPTFDLVLQTLTAIRHPGCGEGDADLGSGDDESGGGEDGGNASGQRTA